MRLKGIMAAAMVLVNLLTPGMKTDFKPELFVLPESARSLVVVEGTDKKTGCRVYVYEKDTDKNTWNIRLAVEGNMGENGMSSKRVSGDRTTPIGIWMADTPFGQSPAQEGFPKNYVQVDESYVWSDDTNTLVRDTSQPGERVGDKKYAGFYNYVINMGYNKKNIKDKGTALFIHCGQAEYEYCAGCVEIPESAVAQILKLYGKYGEGSMFIACAPKGKVDLLYNAYGANDGLSPEGDF